MDTDSSNIWPINLMDCHAPVYTPVTSSPMENLTGLIVTT